MKAKKKSPRILRKISIGGNIFKIKYVDMDDWGQTHLDEKEIWISKKCTADSQLLLTTLVHELTHAAIHLSGADFSAFDGDENKEEGLVRALESILFPCIFKLIKEFA